jgi:hypothetical protein
MKIKSNDLVSRSNKRDLSLKDSEDTLEISKPKNISTEDWAKMNKNAVIYIKMDVKDYMLPHEISNRDGSRICGS